MKIICDPPKRLANLVKHRLDLMSVTEDFFADAVVVAAKKTRFLALGWLGDLAVAVVFKPLGSEAISVISLRLASKKERRLL